MDPAKEDNSPGTPLLTAKKNHTAESIDSNFVKEPDSFHSANSTMTGFAKKKLSETRNVSLPRINIPDMSQKGQNYSQRVPNVAFTPQANSPLHTFMMHTGEGSADLRMYRRDIIAVRVYLPHLFKEEGAIDDGSTCVQLEVSRGVRADELLHLVAQSQDIDFGAAMETFAIWMCSPLLELQLKSHHQPCELRRGWKALLEKFAADSSPLDLENDEPLLYLKRNVQLSMDRELELMSNPKLVNLLWWDAKVTLFAEKYYLESPEASVLAGIGFAIDYAGKEPKMFTSEFVRRNLENQLPDHLADVIRGPMMFGKTLSSGRDLESVLDTWRKVSMLGTLELKKRYLAHLRENCQQYGCAFFSGSIERPSVSPLKNLKRFFQAVTTGDPEMAVTIAINRESITVADSEKHEIILLVRIRDCCWRKIPEDDTTNTNDEEEMSLPMVLLHFPEEPNGISKKEESGPRTNILQIFGYQAALIYSMLTTMANLNKAADQLSDSSAPSSCSSSGDEKRAVNRTPSLTKCDRMCLATFVNGECVKASGSLKKVNWRKMQVV